MSKADISRESRTLWLCKRCGTWSTDSTGEPPVHTARSRLSKVPESAWRLTRDRTEYPGNGPQSYHALWWRSFEARHDGFLFRRTQTFADDVDGDDKLVYDTVTRICDQFERWEARRAD